MKWLGLAPLLVVSVAAYACSGSFTSTGGKDGGDDGSGGGASSGGASGSGSGGGTTSGSSGGAGGSTSGGTSSSGAGGSSGAASSSGSSGAASSSGSGGSSGTSGSSGSSGAGCTPASGCPTGQLCGFPSADGCAAKGQCFPTPGATCRAYSPGCACDGTEISVVCNGLPTGYDTKPLAYTGACGQVDAGGACTSDVECTPGTKCCYPCGIPGCTNQCIAVPAGGSCPLYP